MGEVRVRLKTITAQLKLNVWAELGNIVLINLELEGVESYEVVLPEKRQPLQKETNVSIHEDCLILWTAILDTY